MHSHKGHYTQIVYLAIVCIVRKIFREQFFIYIKKSCIFVDIFVVRSNATVEDKNQAGLSAIVWSHN